MNQSSLFIELLYFSAVWTPVDRGWSLTKCITYEKIVTVNVEATANCL